MTQKQKQGDELAPAIFNISLEKVNDKLNKSTQIVAYVDNINIIGKLMVTVKEIYMELDEGAKEVGLKINTDKTKVLTQTRSNRVLHNGTFGDDNLERVGEFTYLKVRITRDGSEKPEI